MFGYQQTAYNYGSYAQANGQQANYMGAYGQQGNPAVTAAAITPMGTATNAYANSQYSLAATAYAQYGQAAQQQQAVSASYAAGIQPPPPPDYSAGTASCAYGVIGGGKPPGNKTSMATGANAVAAGHHSHYAGYEQAVYAAATNYIQAKNHVSGGGGGWAQKNTGGPKGYPKKRYGLGHQNRDMQQFFCELCKISCAGQAAYKDHMEGKPHKRKEQAAKEDPQTATRGRIGFRCDVCDLTCSSKDTFDAHVKGQKHQRTIALLRRMGKSVPEMNFDTQRIGEAQGQPIPTVGSGGPLKKVVGVTGTKFVGGSTLLSTGEELKSGGGAAPNPVASITGAVKPQDLEKALLGDENVKPVGQEFIEEEKDARGKFLTYICKLCDCKFSDIGAKNVHLKGRRHRLNYKQKVDPSLKVEMKPANWGRNKDMLQPAPLGAYIPGGAPAFQIVQQPRPIYPMQRNQEIMDDRHVLHKLEEIQLKAEMVRSVEHLALLAEKTLKAVSDSMINTGGWTGEQVEQNRVLKGVMRVGLLAKHLLINSDNQIELVVLCSKVPTITLLREVVELFKKNAEIPSNEQLTVTDLVDESALAVQLSTIPFTCRVTLTSVALRDTIQPVKEEEGTEVAAQPTDPLPKDPCLNALAELRHAKFYQVKCAPLHSMNSTVKIVRDISRRVATWGRMDTWTVELLCEKTLGSIQMPLSPGDAIRRIFELISSGVYLGKRSKLLDPCEKEPVDVLAHISDQEREDITSSAQHALRLIAYNQIYKILGIDRLADPFPPPASQLQAQNGGAKTTATTGMKRRADGSSAAGGTNESQDPMVVSGDLGFRPAAEHSAAATGQDQIPAEGPDVKKGKIEPTEGGAEGKKE